MVREFERWHGSHFALHARWFDHPVRPVDRQRVTDAYSYDTAGGTTAPAGWLGPNGSSIILAAAPTKAGYTFTGWSDGTTTYQRRGQLHADSQRQRPFSSPPSGPRPSSPTPTATTAAGGTTAPAGGSGPERLSRSCWPPRRPRRATPSRAGTTAPRPISAGASYTAQH